MDLWVLLPTGVGIITSIIGYLTKRSIDTLDQKIGTTNQRLDDLESKLEQTSESFASSVKEIRKEFYDYKEKVSEEYVKKKDFNGMAFEINKKLDKMYDIILDMKGKI